MDNAVHNSGGSKIVEQRGGEDNLSVSSSNAHNELYAFYTEKRSFLKKILSQ